MKFYNTCFVIFIITAFNIFHLVSAGKQPNISGTKGKMKVEGDFDNCDANAKYYIAMYVQLPSGKSHNYLTWFTFTTGEKIKSGIESDNDPGAVFPYDWQYNSSDPEGKITYENGYVRVCKLKETFKTDEYKAKYSSDNSLRMFNVLSPDVLKEFATEVTEDCSTIEFLYKWKESS